MNMDMSEASLSTVCLRLEYDLSLFAPLQGKKELRLGVALSDRRVCGMRENGHEVDGGLIDVHASRPATRHPPPWSLPISTKVGLVGD